MSQFEECKICKNKSNYIFSAKILNKFNIKYFHCKNCYFLQTQTPYWLQESYEQPINNSDTGYMQRNITLSRQTAILAKLLFKQHSNFLDYAGGYGVFVRLMRDFGFNFFWQDKYTKNIFSQEYVYDEKLKIDAITSFESFEHFDNPKIEFEKLLAISDTIIFSTEILSSNPPSPESWWYYGLEHGQHISFYSTQTMKFLAKEYNLNYYNFGLIKIFTKKSIPFYVKYLLKLQNLDIMLLFRIAKKFKLLKLK